MTHHDDKDLARFVVRVGDGTGFFVAQGLVLTCAHVISPFLESKLPVPIKWGEQPLIAEVLTKHDGQPDDIALLKVKTDQNPVVDLGSARLQGCEVVSVGFPMNNAGVIRQETVTGEIEGSARDNKLGDLIKFKGGQVGRGCSGAPLLNKSSELVCGMICWTRDRHLAEGGYAIPVAGIVPRLIRMGVPKEIVDLIEDPGLDRHTVTVESLCARIHELDRVSHRSQLDGLLTHPPQILAVLIDGEDDQGHGRRGLHDYVNKVTKKRGWVLRDVPWPERGTSNANERYCSLLAKVDRRIGGRSTRGLGGRSTRAHVQNESELVASILDALSTLDDRVWFRHVFEQEELDGTDSHIIYKYWHNIWCKASVQAFVTFEFKRPVIGVTNLWDPFLKRRMVRALREHILKQDAGPHRLIRELPELTSVTDEHIATWLSDISRHKPQDARSIARRIMKRTAGRYDPTASQLEEEIVKSPAVVG